jgi:hypothetical protein
MGPDVPLLEHCCITVESEIPLLEHCLATVGTVVTIGTYCAAVASDHISATMTSYHIIAAIIYMM